jgi:chaperonin GroES
MKIKPLSDRLVVERIEQDEKTAGGIIIPDNAKEKPQKGKVLAIGPGAYDNNGKLIPMHVSIGDIVLFTKWGGTEFKEGSTEYLVLKETDVIGIIEETGSKRKAA